MGHMLNNTIQDVLIRRARMQGKNACWVPGTDHASIATETKVVQHLAEKGLDKHSIGREAFLEHAWAWKEKYGGIILSQLRKLGASLDWDREAFTMSPELSRTVVDAFVQLYHEGLIYRGTRMVNWDPASKSAISDEEVIYEEQPLSCFPQAGRSLVFGPHKFHSQMNEDLWWFVERIALHMLFFLSYQAFVILLLCLCDQQTNDQRQE